VINLISPSFLSTLSRDTKKKKQIPIFANAKTCPYASLVAATREREPYFLSKNSNQDYIIMPHTQYPIAFSGMTRNHLQFQDYFFYLQDVVDWLERHGTCYKYKYLP